MIPPASSEPHSEPQEFNRAFEPETSAPTEISSISEVLHSEAIGEHQIIPVGESGYLIRLIDKPATPGNDWVLEDLDDTLVAYTAAKAGRLDAYIQLLDARGIAIERDTAESAIDLTDKFARWDENGNETYHFDAHQLALAWVTDELVQTPISQQAERLQDLAASLEATKDNGQNTMSGNGLVPFQFIQDTGLIVDSQHKFGEVQDAFRPMLSPDRFLDILEATDAVNDAIDEQDHINLGILTYGEPVFQLRKVVDLMEERARLGKPMKASHIFLTKKKKGDFVRDLLNELPAEAHEEVFSDVPHTILLIDDSPKELDSFNGAKSALADRNTRLTVLRYLQEGTKAVDQNWGLAGHDAYMNVGKGVYDGRSVVTETSESIKVAIHVYLLNNTSRVISDMRQAGKAIAPEVAARLNDRQQRYLELTNNSPRPRYLVEAA